MLYYRHQGPAKQHNKISINRLFAVLLQFLHLEQDFCSLGCLGAAQERREGWEWGHGWMKEWMGGLTGTGLRGFSEAERGEEKKITSPKEC